MANDARSNRDRTKPKTWYVKRGSRVDELLATEVKRLAAAGDIGPTDLVSPDGHHWRPAADYNLVFGLTPSRNPPEHQQRLTTSTVEDRSRSRAADQALTEDPLDHFVQQIAAVDAESNRSVGARRHRKQRTREAERLEDLLVCPRCDAANPLGTHACKQCQYRLCPLPFAVLTVLGIVRDTLMVFVSLAELGSARSGERGVVWLGEAALHVALIFMAIQLRRGSRLAWSFLITLSGIRLAIFAIGILILLVAVSGQSGHRFVSALVVAVLLGVPILGIFIYYLTPGVKYFCSRGATTEMRLEWLRAIRDDSNQRKASSSTAGDAFDVSSEAVVEDDALSAQHEAPLRIRKPRAFVEKVLLNCVMALIGVAAIAVGWNQRGLEGSVLGVGGGVLVFVVFFKWVRKLPRSYAQQASRVAGPTVPADPTIDVQPLIAAPRRWLPIGAIVVAISCAAAAGAYLFVNRELPVTELRLEPITRVSPADGARLIGFADSEKYAVFASGSTVRAFDLEQKQWCPEITFANARFGVEPQVLPDAPLVVDRTRGSAGFVSRPESFQFYNVRSGALGPMLKWDSPAVFVQSKVSPDGKRLLVQRDRQTAEVWNVDGQTLQSTMHGVMEWDSTYGRLASAEHGVAFPVITPGGDYVLSLNAGAMEIWNCQTGKKEHAFTAGGTGMFGSFARPPIAQDREHGLIAVSCRSEVIVWSCESHNEVCLIPQSCRAVSFIEGGSLLVTRDAAAVSLWDTTSGQLEKTFEHPGVSAEAVSADGERLVTLGQGKLKIWNVKDSTPAASFDDYSTSLFTDGHTLLTSSGGELRMYDIATAVMHPTRLEGASHEMRYVPQRKMLLTRSGDGTYSVWQMPEHSTSGQIQRLAAMGVLAFIGLLGLIVVARTAGVRRAATNTSKTSTMTAEPTVARAPTISSGPSRTRVAVRAVEAGVGTAVKGVPRAWHASRNAAATATGWGAQKCGRFSRTLAKQLPTVYAHLVVWFPFLLSNPGMEERRVRYSADTCRSAGAWTIRLPETCWQCGSSDNLTDQSMTLNIRAFDAPVPILLTGGITAAVFFAVALITSSMTCVGLACAALFAVPGAMALRSWNETVTIDAFRCEQHADTGAMPDVVSYDGELHLFLGSAQCALDAATPDEREATSNPRRRHAESSK